MKNVLDFGIGAKKALVPDAYLRSAGIGKNYLKKKKKKMFLVEIERHFFSVGYKIFRAGNLFCISQEVKSIQNCMSWERWQKGAGERGSFFWWDLIYLAKAISKSIPNCMNWDRWQKGAGERRKTNGKTM
jgi:hypothetical protein